MNVKENAKALLNGRRLVKDEEENLYKECLFLHDRYDENKLREDMDGEEVANTLSEINRQRYDYVVTVNEYLLFLLTVLDNFMELPDITLYDTIGRKACGGCTLSPFVWMQEETPCKLVEIKAGIFSTNTFALSIASIDGIVRQAHTMFNDYVKGLDND